MRPVHARGGMKVLPDCVLTPAADLDVLLVPGGDVTAILKDDLVIRWIAARPLDTAIVASVCTGAFLLARAGLLNGLDVTTHWEDQRELQADFPALIVKPGVAWIDCGKVVTSGGISAGIDMSLHLVERLAGRELAEATARQMEFDWTENR